MSVVVSETCCKHRRYVGECGECERKDIVVGSSVQVADDGTGSVVTWFDGIVTKIENGRLVVDAEPFGEGVWDRVKPLYKDVIRVYSQPSVEGSEVKKEAPVKESNPSPIPLAAPLVHGTKVTVAPLEVIRKVFGRHQWTVTPEVAGRCDQEATVTAVDNRDKTVKLKFADGGIVGQWWPFDAVQVVTQEGEELTEMVERHHHIDPATPVVVDPEERDETGVRKAVRSEVEDALAAANAAAKLYSTPEGSVDNCGHGNLRAECGKCPRLELKVGDKIHAAEKGTQVWFKGVVTKIHEYGYPTVKVDGFEGESVWDRVKKHVDKIDLGCPHKRYEELCGRCPREDLAVNEEVKISIDGKSWSDGVIVGKASDGSPKVAIKGQSVGFGWDWVGPKEARVKQTPVPATMEKCKHNRISDVCGQCMREDLKRGMRVKVSMDGSNQDTAVFDGIVSESNPEGTVVKVPGFEEMIWDRTWLATYTKPLDLYADAERVRRENEKRRVIEEQAALLPPRSDFEARTSEVFREAMEARERHLERARLREEDRVRRDAERRELQEIIKIQAEQAYKTDVCTKPTPVRTSPKPEPLKDNDGLIKPAKVPTGGGLGAGMMSELSARITPKPSPKPEALGSDDGLIKPAKVPLGGGLGVGMMSELSARITPKPSPKPEALGSEDGLIKPAKVPLGGGLGAGMMSELAARISPQPSPKPEALGVEGQIKPAKVPLGGGMGAGMLGELAAKMATRSPQQDAINPVVEEDGTKSEDEYVPLPQPTKKKPKKAGRKAPSGATF